MNKNPSRHQAGPGPSFGIAHMAVQKVDVKKILYASDMSENAHQAFSYASSLADRYGAGIVLLHVLAESPELDDKLIDRMGQDRWEEIKARQMADARDTLVEKARNGSAVMETLDRLRSDARNTTGIRKGVSDEVIVVRGNPGESIVEISEQKQCDIIVMGCQGHGKRDDSIMGGTARRVLRHAKKPVLIVRPSA